MRSKLEYVCWLLAPILLSATFISASQENANPSRVEWTRRLTDIQTALGALYSSCSADSRVIEIRKTEDITGDGIAEALVEYCREGAYTASVALMRLEGGRPVVARIRDSKGRSITPEFLMGASARNGEGTELLPAKHSVYKINWHIGDSGQMDRCAAQAFVWTPKGATFDATESISKEVTRSECARLKQAFGR